MANVSPFCGVRYDLGHVGALSEVICPPYDVIDSKLQNALYDRHPHNVIRMELNRAEEGDDALAKYQRAGRCWKHWQLEGILQEESHPSFYVLHQEFVVDGVTHVRKGLFAKVGLERFDEGNIYPHEFTFPGPKVDRLKLMEATHANLSPIFGLYPDELCEIQSLLEKEIEHVLPIEAKDHLGVTVRLWTIQRTHLLTEISSLFHDKPIYIADGHHRYETAITYRDQLIAKNGGPLPSSHPANGLLMALVGMSDPGLLILPTHRLVSGLANLTTEKLAKLLTPTFDCDVVGKGIAAGAECWERMQMDGTQDVLGFYCQADDTWLVARLGDPNTMAELAPKQTPQWHELAVSRLHVLVMDHLLKAARTQETLEYRYVHLLEEVAHNFSAKKCDLAILVPPATMEHVSNLANGNERMPQKSTYFYPKLPTGLVFHGLKKAT